MTSRRDLLKAAAALALSGLPKEVWALAQDEEFVDFDDLRNYRIENHSETPRVKFFDLRHLTSVNTPEDEFFTFHQTRTPLTSASGWRLRIGGFVEKPMELTLDQLRTRPDKRDLPLTVECSGNVAFGAAHGMVSNGTWTGVGLASILQECGLKSEAREIVFFGQDLEREHADGPEAAHGRSVYVQDAMDPKTMLAFELNGKPLPPDRGFPLRLIVPGWFGMTQIKWLSRIEVLDRRYEGAHMARNYHSLIEKDGLIETSISKTRLKSVTARVTRRKEGSGRFTYRIGGAAWGGPSRVKAVEVSIDGGAWRSATLGPRNGDFAWLLWSLDWSDVKPGAHTIVSRALDEAGNVQPTAAEWKQSIKTLREDNSQWTRRIVI